MGYTRSLYSYFTCTGNMTAAPVRIPSTTEEVRDRYNENASLYALCEPVLDYLGLQRLRQRLLTRASGDVLEVAVGTGANLKYYPADCRLTAVDISESMLEVARRKAEKLNRAVSFEVMDAEHLEFPDNRFDTVVSTLTMCTFIHPAAVLQEMARVCRPEGRILLLEHGRSSWKAIGRWQDRHEQWHAKQLGCHWNRKPLTVVKEAGLPLELSRRSFLGIFHLMIVRPTFTHENQDTSNG